MNKKDLSKVQAERRKRGLRSNSSVVSNIFHFLFGARSENFALGAKKQTLDGKKISLALSRNQLRLVNTAVFSCHNDNFRKIGTPDEKKELKKMITSKMIELTK